ncbi:MAG: hypothetical protein ACREBU_03045, partial [Nitrososphaera sp.]
HNSGVANSGPRPVCDKCGSSNVIKKGKRRNKGYKNSKKKSYKKQKWLCNDCGHWPPDDGSKLLTKEQELACVDAYYHSVVNLEEMGTNVEVLTLDELCSQFGLSKAALSRRIRKIVKSMEDGLETSKKKRDNLGRFLIVDSKHVSIKHHTCYCWIAVDSLKGEPVHFALTNSKEAPAVRQFLFELKIKGEYRALGVVADLEESILAEAEDIFTDEVTGAKPLLQADTVHRLRQIAKRWPYLKWKGRPKLGKRDRESRRADISASERKAIEKRKISPEKAKLRIEFSELACRLINPNTIKENKELEYQMRSRVKEWSTDEIIMEEYDSLMTCLHLYHSKEELGSCPSTSNIVETLNGILKKKLSRMQGFKTFESGQIHLKGFWQTYRMRHFSLDGASIVTDIASSTDSLRANKTETAGTSSKGSVPPEQPIPALLPLPMLPPPPSPFPALSGMGPTPLLRIEDLEIKESSITETAGGANRMPSGYAVHDVSDTNDQIVPAVSAIESSAQHDSVAEVLTTVTQQLLQKFRKSESDMVTMLSSNILTQAPAKDLANKFEELGRDLNESPLSIAINKTDGTITKLTATEGKKESITLRRRGPIDPDRLSPQELQYLLKKFARVAGVLEGPNYEYAAIKSAANAVYRIIKKHGKKPGSSAIIKTDGSIVGIQ